MPKICLLKLRTRFKIPNKDGRCLGILGSHDITGAWDESRPIFATDIGEDSWEASFHMISGTRLEWKWVVYDTHRNKVLQWEARNNRTLVVTNTYSLISTQFDGEECDIIFQKEGLVESTESVETVSLSSAEESDKPGASTSNESRDEICEVLLSTGMSAETSSENGNQILLNSDVCAADDRDRIESRATRTKENELVSSTSDEFRDKSEEVPATPGIPIEKETWVRETFASWRENDNQIASTSNIAAAVNGHTTESRPNTSKGKEPIPAISDIPRMNDKKISSKLEKSAEKEVNVEASGNKHIPFTPNTSVEKKNMDQSAPVVAKKNEPSVLLRDAQVLATSKMSAGRESRVSATCELSHETDKHIKLPVSAKDQVSNQSTSVASNNNKAIEITSELTEEIGEAVPSVTGASNGSGDSVSGGSKENSNKLEMFSAEVNSRNTKYIVAFASAATQTSPKAHEDNIASTASTQTSPSVNKEDIAKNGIKFEQSGHGPVHWSSSWLLVPAAIVATAAFAYIIYRKSR